MLPFNLSDITPAGACIGAIEAARESDRRNARRPFETGERRNVLKGLRSLVRRIAAAMTEKRPAASRLTSRSV